MNVSAPRRTGLCEGRAPDRGDVEPAGMRRDRSARRAPLARPRAARDLDGGDSAPGRAIPGRHLFSVRPPEVLPVPAALRQETLIVVVSVLSFFSLARYLPAAFSAPW